MTTYYAREPSYDYNDLFVYRGLGRYEQFGIGADCRAFFQHAGEFAIIGAFEFSALGIRSVFGDAGKL